MDILKEKYSITELSEMLQLSDHTLRFYEKELELAIPKDERGRRYYTAEMANIMYKIKVMRSEGLEIKAIKKILQDENIFSPNPPANTEEVSLKPVSGKDYEAIKIFFNEFSRQLTDNITTEILSAKDMLTREISKSKLELGACVENSMRKLESKMDKHYQEVDEALGNWRRKNKKKSSIKTLFSRKAQ